MLFIKENYQLAYTFAIAASLAAGASLHAQSVTYDNTGSWDHSNGLGDWGISSSDHYTYTYGETFFAPSSSSVSMDSFTFFLEEGSGTGATIHFEAAVYAWDTANQVATGPALFTEELSLTGTADYQAVTADTGGLTLSAGQNYIALLTLSDPVSLAANSSLDFAYQMGLVDKSTANDGGGTAVWYNNYTSSQLNDGSSWDGTGMGYGSFAWTATFNQVPEPSVMALAGLGAAALLLRRRNSKK